MGGPRSNLYPFLLLLLSGFLAESGQPADGNGLGRPVILKVYPNPAAYGDKIYFEGKNFVAPGSTLRADGTEENNSYQEGTYVEFTTKFGVKRLRATPNASNEVWWVTVPKVAIPGPVKIVTIKFEDSRPVGTMGEAVNLNILDEETPAQKPSPGWCLGALSLLKGVPKKFLRDAYYYQTERAARRAREAFVRRETVRTFGLPYNINHLSYFNSLPQVAYGRPTGARGEERANRPDDKKSLAAQFFAKPKSTDQIPFYTLSTVETMQKDIQEDLHNYLQPFFERLTHLKPQSDPPLVKTGFTRPHTRLAYSIGLSGSGYSAIRGGLSRSIGFRVDFDYVRVNPLTDQIRRTMSFSLGADSRQNGLDWGREQRFLFLIRFR